MRNVNVSPDDYEYTMDEMDYSPYNPEPMTSNYHPEASEILARGLQD